MDRGAPSADGLEEDGEDEAGGGSGIGLITAPQTQQFNSSPPKMRKVFLQPISSSKY